MKTTHITKAIALVMTVMMLIGCVPASVLPVFALSASESGNSVFDTVTLGKGTVTNTESYNAGALVDAKGNAIVDNTLSPYEPYSTNDENHPFLDRGAAWIDLSQIYYGAPATPNMPITKWSANTSVVNITGTGKKYTAGIASGQEMYSIHDMNLIDEYLWAGEDATVGKNTENGIVESDSDTQTGTVYFHCTEADRAAQYNGEKQAVFTNSNTYENMGFTWDNKDGNDSIGEASGEIIDRYGNPVTATYLNSNDGIHRYYYTYTYNTVEPKNGTAARVYNRYDAMQGKWGLTLDRNVSSVVWRPSFVDNYFGEGDKFDMNNSVLYLSDTPYLYYSTEAPDSAQMAISLLIGAPVQSEKKANDKGNTKVTWDVNSNYEFRWYTITDNSARPGVAADTLDNSMVPLVTVSDVVLDDYTLTNLSDDILGAIHQRNPDNVNPIKVAENAGIDPETLYVDGAITGCIDFTQLLPLLMDTGAGRADVQYKIAQIRVDTKTKTRAAGDSAVRINYMYFGPGQAAIYTPQSTVGNDISGMNWMYAQNDHGLGDQDANYVAKEDYHFVGNSAFSSYECSYTNGWHNGQTVSVTNTPNDPQKLTIDTYGNGYGELITYEQYKTEMTDYYKANGAVQDSQNGNWYYEGHPVEWLATFTKGSVDGDATKIWKYTDSNGETQYLEAEYNSDDNKYYIMVSVPIRKWVNVLGDSRKIQMKLTMLQAGKETSEAPSFCIWGNNYGVIGAGHANMDLGVRYSGEDILGVFGKGYYNVDCANNNKGAFVDYTFGESVFYNDSEDGITESWFDWLRSPYTYDRTVTDSFLAKSGATYSVDDEMIGYTFVTTLRVVMPIGSKISIQGMKGDGNSAGLNSYSLSGHIVSAYDGGTGTQPMTDVSNTVPEYNATYNATQKDFTMTDIGTVNGTITNGAAAYGPMLPESRYTIYDLLDTEMIKSTADQSHDTDNLGKARQPVYGEVWKAKKGDAYDANLPIYPSPSRTKHGKYGYVRFDSSSSREFIIYHSITFNGTSTSDYKNGDVWGLVGVLTNGGKSELGWVPLYEAGREDNSSTSDNERQLAQKQSGTLLPGTEKVKVDPQTFDYYYYTRNAAKKLNGYWMHSNLIAGYSGFMVADGSVKEFEFKAGDVYSQNYSCMMPIFANMWTGATSLTNSYANTSDAYFRTVNGTDLEFGFKRNKNASSNWSVGLSRALTTPITLTKKESPTSYSYPVLYLDYTSAAHSSGDASFLVALSMIIDGAEYIYYVNGNSNLSSTRHATTNGNKYCYLSFEDIMTAHAGKTIQVTGVSLYAWRAGSANIQEDKITIRRCEIWQGINEWYDEIIADNQNMGGNTSTAMNSLVKDSVHVINDSFYNTHDEADDGSITVTKNADNSTFPSDAGINSADGGYNYTYSNSLNSNSYVKSNSNKGWKAYIRFDSDKDGNLEATDNTYYSFDNNKVDGVYEYHTSVGNLRIWSPANMQTSVVFESDRSFSTKNYRYLYYSYSMRDVETGISAEEADTARTDDLKPGISVAIKSNQLGSHNSYSEIVAPTGERTWAFYGVNNAYWTGKDQDNRTFKTTINAAADLSTFEKIESVNQFVFYLNNPLNEDAEFYINYILLSNVPPEEMVADSLDRTQMQYYYMMDNTGDRYSARFPTIDNPTGQVSGTNADTDRVNPIKVVRGEYLSNGTYFNGDRLYGYGGTANTDRGFNENLGSVGYYEKTYGNDATPNAAENGSMKNIMFYMGASDDLNDINDYYGYKDRGRVITVRAEDGTLETKIIEADGVANEYDMLWSYGRWFTGDGESGLNIMYIGDPNLPQDNGSDTANGVSGALVRRYATENYVLLRSGITPKTYTTYFDANGGEFIYDTSADDITDLRQVTENNYFVTENVILSYFRQPYNIDSMKGDTGSENAEFIKKPGYKFSHWEHYTDYNTKNENFNVVDGEVTSEDGNGSRFMTFIKKTGATPDYFKAVWVVDTETYPADERHHAKFLDTNGDVLKTITVGGETVDVNARYGRFLLNFPNTTVLYSGHDKVAIYGWQIQGDTSGRIFSAGEKIYLLDDGEFMDEDNTITFVPVTSPDKMNTFEITLHNAELFVKVKNYANEIVDRPAEDYGITLKKSGSEYTYSGVMENYSLVAKPVASAKNAESGWTLVVENTAVSQKKHVINGLVPVLSENSERYEFTAHENIEISYSSITNTIANAFYTANKGIYVTTSPRLTTDGNKGANKPAVYFTSQFTIDNNNVVYGEILASGTLLTKSTYYDNFADVNTAFALDMSTVNAATVANKTYKTMDTKAVRSLQATAVSSNYEYTAYIGHTKAEPATYYARAYVIYKDGNTVKVAYSDVVAWDIGSYTA